MEVRLPASKYKAPAWEIWVALTSVYIIWGSTYLAIRFAIDTIPPFLMAAVRFIIAGTLLYLFRRWRGDPAPLPREWRSAIIIGFCLIAGGNGAVVWAEQRVPTGLTALMIGMTPLWIVALDWIRPFHRLRGQPGGRRPPMQALLGVLVGFFGVVLLIGLNAFGSLGGVDPLGALALVLGTFLWASGSLYNRTARLPRSPFMATAMEMLAGAGVLLILSLVAGDWAKLDLAAVTSKSLLAMAYLVVFGSWIAFSAYVWLLRVAPTPLVATYAYVNPVVALALGSLFAGEKITPRDLVAAAFILGAVVLTTTAPRAPRRAEGQPVTSAE
jgi:drug/metabolite transporter (DMT)-like permease